MTARHQLGYWRDSKSLLAHSIAVAPGSPLLEWSLGHIYAREGKYDDAEPLLRSSVPAIDTSEVHNEYGNVLWLKGRIPAAAAEYEQAIARDPRNAEALYNSARALEAQGLRALARRRYIEFLRVAPPSLDGVKREVERTLQASAE